MIPKEKAKELFNEFLKVLPDVVEVDKKVIQDSCLIVASEALGQCVRLQNYEASKFWKDVKDEIGYL